MNGFDTFLQLPFDIEDGVDFVTGLRTIAGSGDPSLREGLATHISQPLRAWRSARL